MKRYTIFYLIGWLVCCTACEEVLTQKPNSEVSTEDVWRIPELAQGVLMQAYARYAGTFDTYDGNFIDIATDNAATNNYGSALYQLSMGNASLTVDPLACWSNNYATLQYIHQFLENGLTDKTQYDRVDPEVDAQTKVRLRGEAYFLRAWWSFELLKHYGGKTDDGEALGYPIVTRYVTQAEAENFDNFRRNTYAECAAQIIADLDSAMALLPDAYKGADVVVGAEMIGRATALAAAVFKTRVALFAACPAYQPDAVTQITGMGSFTVVDPVAYQQRWAYAALVADSVLQLSGFGNYVALKATDLADAPNTTPADFVFRKYGTNKAMEGRHFPPFYYGGAQTEPSQNFVDAFPARNGFPISDPRSGYNPQDPYVNRDNRFELNIYYQGKTFGTAGYPIDVVAGGKDGYGFRPNVSRTGYYLAKHLSKKETMLNPIQGANAQHYLPLLRKAEVFYNYAEAANEAWGPKGKDPEGRCKYTAYDIIKTVRKSSGGITDTQYLDEMAADKDAFRRLIQNERRLEFAFEEQRYYDLRRWLLPLNEPIRAMTVTRDEAGAITYTPTLLEERKMDDVRFYYAPLPYEELLKNKNLVNNRGWK